MQPSPCQAPTLSHQRFLHPPKMNVGSRRTRGSAPGTPSLAAHGCEATLAPLASPPPTPPALQAAGRELGVTHGPQGILFAKLFPFKTHTAGVYRVPTPLHGLALRCWKRCIPRLCRVFLAELPRMPRGGGTNGCEMKSGAGKPCPCCWQRLDFDGNWRGGGEGKRPHRDQGWQQAMLCQHGEQSSKPHLPG